MGHSPPVYSFKEEIANSTTHGIGALLSTVALVLLIVYSALNGNIWHIVSCSIFGASLVLLYTASTFYHLATTPKIKKWLRAIDHSSIFLLIAGTYTPFTLVSLRGAWGWTLFGLVWGIAFIGIFLETITRQRFEKASLTLYLGLGWLIILAIKPIIDSVAPGGIVLLVSGGLCYSLGVFFYVWKSLHFHHAIWHLFVLAGSSLHFFSIFFYIIPGST
jgi:hemolysin III